MKPVGMEMYQIESPQPAALMAQSVTSENNVGERLNPQKVFPTLYITEAHAMMMMTCPNEALATPGTRRKEVENL